MRWVWHSDFASARLCECQTLRVPDFASARRQLGAKGASRPDPEADRRCAGEGWSARDGPRGMILPGREAGAAATLVARARPRMPPRRNRPAGSRRRLSRVRLSACPRAGRYRLATRESRQIKRPDLVRQAPRERRRPGRLLKNRTGRLAGAFPRAIRPRTRHQQPHRGGASSVRAQKPLGHQRPRVFQPLLAGCGNSPPGAQRRTRENRAVSPFETSRRADGGCRTNVALVAAENRTSAAC